MSAVEIIVENVRSFFGRHEIPLRQITLLVGENSTGKSTFLATIAALASPERYPERPAFNEPPFNLGSYETIASRRPEHRRAEETFAIGFRRQVRDGLLVSVATYRGRSGQVEMAEFEASSPRGTLRLQRHQDFMVGRAQIVSSDAAPVTLQFGGSVPGQEMESRLPSIYYLVQNAKLVGGDTPPSEEASKHIPDVVNLWADMVNPRLQAVPLAPIRSKPSRVYEQLDTPFRPEGDHIPIRLARILRRGSRQRERRTELSQALDTFGQESGLFSHVEVRKLSPSPTAPFEILVTVGAQRVNIADVGYGVSQVLPVVAESVLAAHGTLLLQQPEVHLHPKAQAALGTFLCGIAVQSRIVVETHSDFLIDRIRQEVASGRVSPTKVLILYFERSEAGTQVHPIHLDSEGNLVDAPLSYRDFFMEEELRLLSRGSQ